MLLGCNLLSGTFPSIKSNLIDLLRICVHSITVVFNFIAFFPILGEIDGEVFTDEK